jgi:hypothetical protein
MQSAMKRLLLKLALFLPVFFIIVSINYLVDPANLFQAGRQIDSYEKGLAELLLARKNVANVSNYDERLLQKYYIHGMTRPKDVVVLGSSRSMSIHSSQFPGQTFFNNGVSGATIEDYIAVTEMDLQQGLKPSTVIMGLDPWVLNRNHGQIRWKSLESEYRAGLKRLQIGLGDNAAASGLSLEKYLELISPAYFQASLRKLAELVKNPETVHSYYPTQDVEADGAIRLSDGSLNYDVKTRVSTVEEVHQQALAYMNTYPVYSLGTFWELDADLKTQLESLVDTLRNERIRVVFFLPPYHPEVYVRLMASENYRIIGEAQRYLTDLADKKGVTLVGSYNPLDVGCGPGDFYDGMHPRESCIDKIFKTYK